MSLRHDWKFQFDSKKLLMAAAEKRRYHEDRLAHWSGEVDQLEADLMEKGIEIRPQEVTGGRRFDVNVDTALRDQVNRAYNRKEKHEGKVDEYARWERAFELMNGRTYELDVDDVAYFGL